MSNLHPNPPLRLDRAERDVLWRLGSNAMTVQCDLLHVAGRRRELGVEAQASAAAARIVFEIFDAVGWDLDDPRAAYSLPMPFGPLVLAALLESWHKSLRGVLHDCVAGPFADDRPQVDEDLDDLAVLDRIISRLVAPETAMAPIDEDEADRQSAGRIIAALRDEQAARQGRPLARAWQLLADRVEAEEVGA